MARSRYEQDKANELEDDKTYMIKRLFRDDKARRGCCHAYEGQREGLTLEEAKEHCQRDDTSGDGWFDAFEEE